MKIFLSVVLLLLLLAGIIAGVYLVRRQQTIKSKAVVEGTRIEIVNNNGDLLTTSQNRKVKLKLSFQPAPSPSPIVSSNPSPSPSPVIPSSPSPAGKSYSPKVMLLIFNPMLSTKSGKKLSVYKGWNDPDTLVANVISDIKTASGGIVNYTIAQRREISGYNKKENGFVMYETYYLNTCLSGSPDANCNAMADYKKIISDYGICGKLDRGEIDELWLFGGPWFGYWESNLAGPNAFWYNSSPTTGTSCKKLLPIMGFNFERSETEMFEDFGHRLESTMLKVFGTWSANYEVKSAAAQNDWDKFTMLDNQNSGNGGCGNAHTAFNSSQVSGFYDRTSSRIVSSRCKDFANYPNLTGPSENLNCSAWGCSDLGYYKDWLFKYLPRASGSINGKLNNWWAYLVDPQNTIIGNSVQGVSTVFAQEGYPSHFKVANSSEALGQAQEQLYDSSPKIIDWELTEGNGKKTVYGQFKVNNTWSDVYTASIELTVSPSPSSASSPLPSSPPSASSEPIESPPPSPAGKKTYIKTKKDVDFNKDDKVNTFEVSMLYKSWRSSSSDDIAVYDLNEDEAVNTFDYAILLLNLTP